MSNDLNLCQFIGNLGQDPETRVSQQGKHMATISIAVGSKWKDKQSGQQKESTEWVRVVFFDRIAEVVGKYLKKGSKVYISGKMQTRKWQDAQGVDKYTTEIVGKEMQMLDSRGDANTSQQAPPQQQAPQQDQQQAQQPAPSGFDDFDDDIPF